MNFCQKKLDFSEFIDIYADFCQFFDVFQRIYLTYITQAPHIYTPTPIFSSKTRIRPRSHKKNLKKPNFPPILKISILNHVNLRKLFPPKSFLLPTLNPAFQRLSLRPPGGLFSQLTARLI